MARPRKSWPLWECLEPETLAKLAMYQWNEYGLIIEWLSNPFLEVESLEEIDKLMRQPSHPGRKGV